MKVKDGRETVTSKIAYIAGFFDGEGCVRLKNANHVIAHITNSNQRILMQVQDLFGGQIRRQERTPNKTIYNWYITSAEAVDFLRTVSPFLQEKGPQAMLAIKFHEKKGSLTKEEKESYARVMTEMKKQNPLEIIGNVHVNPTLINPSATTL